MIYIENTAGIARQSSDNKIGNSHLDLAPGKRIYENILAGSPVAAARNDQRELTKPAAI